MNKPPVEQQPAATEASPPRKRGWGLPPLARYVLLRVLAAVPVLIGVTFICFTILMAAPGDPVRIVMGQHYDEDVAANLRAKWGLDRPFIVQYGMFLGRVGQGDLGRSYVKSVEVGPFLLKSFRNTLYLTIAAMIIAVFVGMLAGIASAAWPRRPVDYILMLLAVAGISIPVFWLGLMLQLYFGTTLHWLPTSGMIDNTDRLTLWNQVGGNPLAFQWHATIKYYILPSITLATVPMAIIARLTRSSLLEVMGQDYIRTARAKGLGYTRVVLVHGLKNALIPIITVIGNNFALLLTGAVLTETVFNWPGLGSAMVMAIQQYDYPIVLGGVMLMAVVFVFVNLVVDLTYGLIDPRVRYG